MKRSVHKLIALTLTLGSLLSLTAQTEPYTNNWYVGNTKPGEWIKYKQVWLSEGHYRFTTQSVAKSEGQTVHLEINNETLKNNVPVPTDPEDEFQLVHLGYKKLETGYYDIKLIFETGDVNCDMIFIRKSDSTADYVLDDDIKYELNFDDGMHTFAIGGFANSTKDLLKGHEHGDDATWTSTIDGGKFSRRQVQAYTKPSIYTFDLPFSSNSADVYIQEMVEAKVEVIFAHGRGEPTDNIKQIEDRAFKTGPGGMPCSGLKYMVEAIERNPYARGQMKVAYFVDNAPLTLSVQAKFNGDYEWGNPEHQQYIWDYAIKKWYETVPRDMLFFTEDGKVPMQWWTANSHLEYPKPGYEILEFFQFIEKKMKEEFDLEPAFILAGNFFERDPRTKDYAWGVQGWFIWGKKPIEIQQHKGKYFAFALNGGRLPMREQATGDWDPVTNLPTPSREDAHFNALLEDGTPMIRQVFEEGHAVNSEWIVLEAWSDWREGSTWHRSDHEEYLYPNQYISLVREFADRNSGSILLEAEGCDEYYSTTSGNMGGFYRLDIYKESELEKEYIDANLEVDLDIFRPLHSLSELSEPIYTRYDEPFKKISAGWKDVWAITKNNMVKCNEIDGYPISLWIRSGQALSAIEKITFGSNMVWVIDTYGNVRMANLPDQSGCETSSGFTVMTDPNIKIVDIAASMSMIWGVDDQNKVYYRNLSGTRPWQQVEGELTSITADVYNVWGFSPDGEIMCMSAQNKTGWRKIGNPHNLIKLSAGSGEVWGINEQNQVYRISSSGVGNWKYVTNGVLDVSVGVDFVWLLDMDGIPYNYRLRGFERQSGFDAPTSIGNKVKLTDISLIAKPNPFHDNLTAIINSYVAEPAKLDLYDMNGKMVLSQNIQLFEGTNEVEVLNVQPLPSGMYILSVSSKAHTERMKVMKVK